MQNDGHQLFMFFKEALMDLVLGFAQIDRVNGKAIECLTEALVSNWVLDTEPSVAVVWCQQDRAAVPITLHSKENPSERLPPIVGNAVGPVIAPLKDFDAHLS